MNIIFLTLGRVYSIAERGVYQDLLRKFRDEGHNVTIVAAAERRNSISTNFSVKDGVQLLQVKTLNMTKTNFIEKGLGTFAIEYQYLIGVKKYLSHIKFDLILYSTPPITLVKVISYLKKRDNAYAYLLLKDIFPQNAVDMKLIRKNGLLYNIFRKKEKELYKISDTIGCMSEANVEFILKHNPTLNKNKLEVNPNSISPTEREITILDKNKIRKKYKLPLNKKIFVYGGNLGRPQGLDFLMETIKAVKNNKVFFLIVGDGTEFNRIKKWFEKNKIQNAFLLKRLPKDDYDLLLNACDVGLIFLDKDFTIPNFPSRLLPYLEMKTPIIAATDPNSDIGDVIEQHQCGIKVEAGKIDSMLKAIEKMCNEINLEKMGVNAWNLLNEKYTVNHSFELIIEKVNERTIIL